MQLSRISKRVVSHLLFHSPSLSNHPSKNRDDPIFNFLFPNRLALLYNATFSANWMPNSVKSGLILQLSYRESMTLFAFKFLHRDSRKRKREKHGVDSACIHIWSNSLNVCVTPHKREWAGGRKRPEVMVQHSHLLQRPRKKNRPGKTGKAPAFYSYLVSQIENQNSMVAKDQVQPIKLSASRARLVSHVSNYPWNFLIVASQQSTNKCLEMTVLFSRVILRQETGKMSWFLSIAPFLSLKKNLGKYRRNFRLVSNGVFFKANVIPSSKKARDP